MGIKKAVKGVGKGFITLSQEEESIIRQSVLIVDNGHSWLGYVNSSIGRIKSHFPNAGVSILTLDERKSGC